MVTTLSDILAHSARKSPNRIAYRFDGHSINYAEANSKVCQLASILEKQGISPKSRVGICLHRCIESFLAVHAILRIGAVFVPIDVKFPANRIVSIVGDCDIKTIVTSPQQDSLMKGVMELVPQIDLIGLKFLDNGISWEEIFSLPLEVQSEVAIAPSDLAYIMYSSGSTGKPKGIVHTHSSGLSYAIEAAGLYGLNERDIVVSHSILSYDISTFAYFASPLVGATTLILSDLICMVPASLSLLLEQEGATVWYSVPLALKQLLNLGALKERNLSALRWVLYGGEPISVDVIKQLISLLPNASFSNVYGPAEVNQCTFYNFKSIDNNAKEIPLGEVWQAAKHFLINDENEILDGHSQTGELVINSTTMMDGYWNSDKPESAIFFTTKSDPTRKYYRTGDLVHKDANGTLYFIGRKDRQVKLHGYRVELKEIEHLLMQLEYLKEVAVIAIRQSGENDYIAVFAVKQIGSENVSTTAVKAYLKKFLPLYALPEVVEFIDEMPYAPSGKMDFVRLEQYLNQRNEGETTSIHSR